MYSLKLSVAILGILVLTVVAKPYHVKITKHSSPKSRDLSKQNKSYFPEPEEDKDYHEDNYLGEDNTKITKPQSYKDYVDNDDKTFGQQWKSWDPLHEDYGSDEYGENLAEKNKIQNNIDNHKDKDVKDDNQIYGKDEIGDYKSDKLKDNAIEAKPSKKPYDPCDSVFCHFGRVCKSYPDGAATCECADESFCLGHKKRVCGSDGVWYPSHCELHRQACLKLQHISIDHSGAICVNGEFKKMEKSEDDKPKKKHNHVKKALKPKAEDEDTIEPLKKEDAAYIEPLNSVDIKVEHVKKSSLKEKKNKDDKQNKKKKKNKKGKKKGKKHDKKVDTPPTPAPYDELKLKTQKQDTEDIILDNNLEQEKKKQDVSPSKVPVVPVHHILDIPEAIEIPCTESEYGRLKDNLLLYHCARIGEKDCYNLGNKKQFLANIMFHYYDRSANGLLDADELSDIEHRDHLGKLSQYCHLTDMLKFDDSNTDDNITIHEFYRAFGVSTVSLDAKLKLITTTISVGNTLELKCDVKGASRVMWKRNGGLLSEIPSDEIKMFEDGSLYIGHVGLHHLGNYTCQDMHNEEVIQSHILSVTMPPKVEVSPETQFHTTGSSVTLLCHVSGVPQPEITWEKNEAPLPNEPQHYTLLYNNATLQISTAMYTTDTGAYKCKAKNSAGQAQDIGTVFIESDTVPKYSNVDATEEFMVFHDNGYSVFEPNHCNIEHQISGLYTDFKRVPLYGSTIPTLCTKDQTCAWGDAVNVKDNYVYVTQPKLNRVVVIDVQNNHNPVELIQTDVTPVSVKYVSHLDQVWVLCWNGEEDGAAKTVVVIRDASQPIQHHTVHTQPIGDRFDLVQDVFLPAANDLEQKFNYGYVLHAEQQGLYKLDLQALKYVKTIDLQDHSCVPVSVAFVPIGGQVMVYCSAPKGQDPKFSRLVLDYITDKVLDFVELGGEPFVSPDAKYLITVDKHTNTIAVYKIGNDGKLQHLFEEYTSFQVSDMTFFPSERGHSYDFFASSADRNDLLYINLASGKIEMIEGIGEAIAAKEWIWSKKNRVIVSGGIFGQYLMTPSKNSVVIIDGKRRHVQCEWQDLKHANVIVWIKPKDRS